MPAKRKNIPLADDIQAMIDDLMPVPALTDQDIDPLQLLLDAPAEEFLKALSAPLRKLFIAGMRNMPAPRTLKEWASVYALFEKAEGLNKPTDKNTMPQGFVVPLRAVRRNIGSFPEPPQPAPTVLELEADMADQVITSGVGSADASDDFEV